jgi:NADH-quinone oxidoreductase E subunit
MFTAQYKQELDRIKGKYEHSRAALLPLLRKVQERDGLITPEAEKDLAEYLGLPIVQIHEVVCFYHLFHQERQGKCHFSVCQTTACALRGAEGIIEYIEQKLNIKPGETTADGKFSLDLVECLGACEIAPMMQCNKDYKGPLTKQDIDELISKNKQ